MTTSEFIPQHIEIDPVEPVETLNKALREAAGNLTKRNARYLVDYYYQVQRDRIRAAKQLDKNMEEEEPTIIMGWVAGNTTKFENNIRNALNAYSDKSPVGRWAKSIVGIGPVIAAGLLAHIDITKTSSVSSVWRYAGLDPTLPPKKKGQELGYHPGLKTLCWKVGESFVKVTNAVTFDGDVIPGATGLDRDGRIEIRNTTARQLDPSLVDVEVVTGDDGKKRTKYFLAAHAEPWHYSCPYARIYLERKELEQGLNVQGHYADQAAAILEAKNIGKETDAYKAYIQGQLPPAHIHARAKRYAVKVLLCHWYQVAYEVEYGTAPPKPWILQQDGHYHEIPIPNWP